MDREQFERMKEAEKEHLRKMKALKAQLRSAQRTARLRQAVEGIARAGETPELDASIEAVRFGAIESEVRLDMALESAAPDAPIEPAVDEEEARRLRAEALVRQMKTALGPRSSETSTGRGPRSAEAPAAPEQTLGEKTIGRTNTRDDAPREPENDRDALPDKTIGRAGARRRSGPDG